jgi:hypothetical protein
VLKVEVKVERETFSFTRLHTPVASARNDTSSIIPDGDAPVLIKSNPSLFATEEQSGLQAHPVSVTPHLLPIRAGLQVQQSTS